MRGRWKRVRRTDGSVYRMKGKKGRWESRRAGRNRGLKTSRDWTTHKVWLGQRENEKTSLKNHSEKKGKK